MPDDLNEAQRRARINAEKILREEHRREEAATKEKWGEVLPGAVVLVGGIAFFCWSATDLPTAAQYFAAGVFASCAALSTVIWWTTKRRR